MRLRRLEGSLAERRNQFFDYDTVPTHAFIPLPNLPIRSPWTYTESCENYQEFGPIQRARSTRAGI